MTIQKIYKPDIISVKGVWRPLARFFYWVLYLYVMRKFDINTCYIVPNATKRKANKNHNCSNCGGEILKSQRYFSFKSAHYHAWHDDIKAKRLVEREYINDKYCTKCNYKRFAHNIRANNRINDCPDGKFEFVWNGGWCDGAPDGGDGEFECRECNLNCR